MGRMKTGLLVGVDAVSGDFDFGDATEGEEQLNEVFGRLFRGLLHDMRDGVGDSSLEHYALSLEAGQIHAHELTCLQHPCSIQILRLRDAKCKLFPGGSGAGHRVRFLE